MIIQSNLFKMKNNLIFPTCLQGEFSNTSNGVFRVETVILISKIINKYCIVCMNIVYM